MHPKGFLGFGISKAFCAHGYRGLLGSWIGICETVYTFSGSCHKELTTLAKKRQYGKAPSNFGSFLGHAEARINNIWVNGFSRCTVGKRFRVERDPPNLWLAWGMAVPKMMGGVLQSHIT